MGWISHVRRATVLSLAVTALLAAAPMGQAATNHPPNVPSNVRTYLPRDAPCGSVDHPTAVRSTPTIQATLTDPDGRARRLSARVEVYIHDTGRRVWVGLSPRVLNPSTVRMALPKLKVNSPDFVYRFRVRADDTIIAGKWSSFCYFRIVTQAWVGIESFTYPAYLGVESRYLPEDGGDKAYGKPGQPGRFRFFEHRGYGQVYKYRLNDDPWRTIAPTERDRSAIVNVTPWRPGLNRLSVLVIDEAGNTSETNVLLFRVAGATQPVAAWRFDERSGDLATDNVGDHDARVSSQATPWDAAGRLNGSLRLGSDDTAATSGSVVDTSKSFSVSAWIRLDEDEDAQVVGQPGFSLARSGGSWSFDRRSASGISRATIATKLARRQWTHLLGVYDSVARKQRLYVNGRLEAEVAAVTGGSAVGAFSFGLLIGAIDHVKVWNRVVPSDEIPSLVDVQDAAQEPQPELLAHWTFDEGTGPTAADSSGRDHVVDLGAGVRWVPAGEGHGTALRLNTHTDGTARTRGPVLDGTGSFTVIARVRPLQVTAPGPVIAVGGAVPAGFTPAPNFELSTFKPPTIRDFGWRFAKSSTLSYSSVQRGSTRTVGQWEHVVGVYDSARGVVRGYSTADELRSVRAPKVWHSDEPLTFGELLPGSESTTAFVGDVDDVRIYAGILSEAQMDAIVNAD